MVWLAGRHVKRARPRMKREMREFPKMPAGEISNNKIFGHFFTCDSLILEFKTI
jgi:hypothetical protein